MLARLQRLDTVRLAADFSAVIRACLSDSELQAVRDRNELETDSGIDHLNDYVAADELMAEAINRQLVDWSWCDLEHEIIEAWNRAKVSGFRLTRVLIACEWSATVRDEFAARGHDATSCDILPSANPHGKHYQGDARDIMNDGFDTMISFPPCTYLSGCQLWRCLPKHDPSGWRKEQSDKAMEFVRDLDSAKVARRCIENPRGRIGSDLRPASQEIHPYQFGHDVSKTTGLWLSGLGLLSPDPADYIAPRLITYKGKLVNRWGNQSPCGADKMGPSADRGHLRGKTYSGIAKAMADTWGGITRALRAPAEVLPLGQIALF